MSQTRWKDHSAVCVGPTVKFQFYINFVLDYKLELLFLIYSFSHIYLVILLEILSMGQMSSHSQHQWDISPEQWAMTSIRWTFERP